MVTALGSAARAALATRAHALSATELRALFPALVLAPHPDDETLGCGGLIATAASLGLCLKLAFLTDGGGSHLGSPTWTRERLERTRKQEAREAVRCLGASHSDIDFLRWPDGDPYPNESAEFEETVRRLESWVSGCELRSIWATWAREPHADHRAAAAVADTLAQRLSPQPARMSYLVWGWQLPELADAPSAKRLACAESIGRRRKALACHRTQTSDLVQDAVEGFCIPPELAALTDEPEEYYLPCP